MKQTIERLGESALEGVEFAGGVFSLFLQTLASLVTPPFRPKQVFDQMVRIGVDSLLIATLTSFFTGVVLAFRKGARIG